MKVWFVASTDAVCSLGCTVDVDAIAQVLRETSESLEHSFNAEKERLTNELEVCTAIVDQSHSCEYCLYTGSMRKGRTRGSTRPLSARVAFAC